MAQRESEGLRAFAQSLSTAGLGVIELQSRLIEEESAFQVPLLGSHRAGRY